MIGHLTTHVLDTALGCPAAGLRIDLVRIDDDQREVLRTVRTNSDGRTDATVLPDAELVRGTYELVLHAGDYQRDRGTGADFLDLIPVRFTTGSGAYLHVPLLLSPYGYSTYRGS